jgi:chromosome segregation and condensation protein ScpB
MWYTSLIRRQFRLRQPKGSIMAKQLPAAFSDQLRGTKLSQAELRIVAVVAARGPINSGELAKAITGRADATGASLARLTGGLQEAKLIHVADGGWDIGPAPTAPPASQAAPGSK